MTYEFEGFRLDSTERLFLRDGQPVALTPKAFDLLVFLVEHHGRLVEKATLMAALWPNAIVEEANLAFQVSALRKALDDGVGGSALIQTVPTKGYRFVGEVVSRSADAAIAPVPGAGAGLTPSADPPRRLIAAAAMSLLGVVIAVGSLLTWRASRQPSGAPAAPQNPMRLVAVTTLTGWQDWPSLSPDGEQVAFAWGGEPDDNQDIYVTILGSRDVRRLTVDPAADFAPAWSPTGREIAFLRAGDGLSSRIRLMSALGGTDRAVSDFPAWASIVWSPDARFIAAGRLANHDPERGIYLVPVSGGAPRAIVSMRAPAEAHAPAFSPDGRQLAFAVCERVDQEGDASNGERLSQGCHVNLVDLDEAYAPKGAPRSLTRSMMGNVGALVWSRDGSTIVFSGHVPYAPGQRLEDAEQFSDHLWRVSPDGARPPELIELAGVEARRATTSSSRDRLVFSRGHDEMGVYLMRRSGSVERLVTSTSIDGHAQFSTDGRQLAFGSDRTGTFEIWVANVDGTSQRQLTRGPTAYQGSPRWSPDGSTIAFDAQEANGDRHIWTIPVEGGAPRQLTALRGEQSAPTWSHDGRWIYFSSGDHDHREIYRVPSTGGRSEQISSGGGGVIAFESADGQHFVYRLRDQDSPLVEASLSGGRPRTVVECVTSFWGFSVQGDSIYYLPCGASRSGEVRKLDRTTGRDAVWGVVPDAFNVPQVAGAYLWDIPIAPDGQSLLLNMTNSRANLWMLENFR